MTAVTATILMIALGLPLDPQAQQSSSDQAATPQSPTSQTKAPAIDPAKMGVSLDRIRRELQQAEVREERGDYPLSLEFRVDVYGTAPRIDLLRDFPLVGPTPFGAPTHREMIDVVTPEEFRAPVASFSNLAWWVAQKLSNRSKRQQCEAELAEYTRLVMQGVNVAAPRCSQ